MTRAMLEDPSTLQFILDTVYQLGGEPQKLEHVRQEAVGSGKSEWHGYVGLGVSTSLGSRRIWGRD